MTSDFPTPIKRGESIFGIVYIVFHSVFLPSLIIYGSYWLGFDITDTQLDLVYYIVSALAMVLALRSFLRGDAELFAEDPMRSVFVAVQSFALYFILLTVSSMLLGGLVEDAGPNEELLDELAQIDPVGSLITGVLLAPIAEELMFRGCLFGTLRKKSRILAYTVTIFAFAFYHLWDSFLFDFQPSLFVHLIFYMVPGIPLCLAYERSETVVSPLLVHMGINLMATLVDIV